ncbi:MAG: hypothetical protein LiPW15_671 [Parcubacteria group bacterium LiPW_15]|nr:MAG: hypothetical protein LiPW15_671 [Parcubacteria group bacterium LiPW_15]
MFKRLGAALSTVGLIGCFMVGASAVAQVVSLEFPDTQESLRQYSDDDPKFPRAWPSEASGKTINMLEYLVPAQTWNDQKPFHLTGYFKCLWGECVDRGDLPYAEGGFFKVYRVPNDGSGNLRYVAMKAPVKPAEYSVVREVFENEEWIAKSFLEAEDMFWGPDGWELRDYHDEIGFPTFEWGRSSAIPGRAYVQAMPWCDWLYCGAKPDRRELLGGYSIYTVQEFDLTGDLAEVVRQLGDRVFDNDMVGVLRTWIALATELGVTEPRLLVVSGYWSPVVFGIRAADPSLWYQREIYSYLKGPGWVGWWWQNHLYGDQRAPFGTMKGGVMHRVVWEDPKNPLLAWDVCAKLPSSGSILNPTPSRSAPDRTNRLKVWPGPSHRFPPMQQ